MSCLEEFCAKIDELNVSVLFCEKFDEKSNIWNFSSHRHDCIELLYFLHGNAEVKLDEKSVNATFYDAIIYPKGVYHTEHLQMNHHQEIICIWVDIPDLEIPDVIHFQDNDAKLKWLLESIHAECKSDSPCQNLIKNYAKAISILVARKYYSNQVGQDHVSRVRMYIQNHIAEKIKVEELADLIFVSKSYLSRIFKNQIGVSLMEYLRMIRIEQAKSMLVSSDFSIEEIAASVGYNCPKHFYKAFNQCTKMSPSKYKTAEKLKRHDAFHIHS